MTGTLKIGLIILVILVPICTILAIAIQLASGKSEPTLFALLVAIPGALVAGWKSLKELGLLRPKKLNWQVENDRVKAISWLRGMRGTGVTQSVTDIIFSVRLQNKDVEKSIDILDVVVSSVDDERLLAPEMQEISLGSEKKWMYPVGGGGAHSELLNDGVVKTLEPSKVKDYVVAVRETGQITARSRVRIAFADNFGRQYAAEVLIPAPTRG